MAMGFNDLARKFFKRLAVSPGYAPGGRTDVEVQNIGYLSEIRLVVTFNYTVVAGGGTAQFITGRGKTTGNPTPWDLIQRVQLNNNQNIPLIDCSGWGLYLFNRTVRSAFDPSNVRASVTDYNPFYVSSSGNAATGSIRVPLIVPIAYKKSLQAGLIFMQDQQINMRLTITWGPGTFLTLAGGATATINSVNIEAEQEYFLVPPDPAAQPSTASVHRILEFTQDIISSGENRYKFPLSPNRVMLSELLELGNNGAGMTDTDITALQLRVAGSDTIQDTTPLMTLNRAMEAFGGNAFPRGLYPFPYYMGLGIPEIGDHRDYIDLGAITSLERLVQINAGTALTNAYLRSIQEYLETPG